MCGDVEEEGTFEADLYHRFVLRSQALVRRPEATHDPLHAYLDDLFADVLQRCSDDAKRCPAADAYRVMTMQSVVLARLAGFLAGHGSLKEDPLRKLLEATMLGYGEAEAPLDLHGHDHDHLHGHDDDHGHAHDRDHGHGHRHEPVAAADDRHRHAHDASHHANSGHRTATTVAEG